VELLGVELLGVVSLTFVVKKKEKNKLLEQLLLEVGPY
jgi:hypothetical protein